MVDKVLIVGLDGGTWRIFDPLMEEGRMPHLQRLLKSGRSGILNSTLPPITPAAWTSFLTGTNPGKHGVFDFLSLDKKAFSVFAANSNSIATKTLFELLSDRDRKVISIGIPMSYPPKRVNGLMVSCFMTPGPDAAFTFPSELKDEILSFIPDFEVTPSRVVSRHDAYGGGFDDFLRGMCTLVRQKKGLALHLLGRYGADVCAVQFQTLDFVQHFLWHCLDPSHPLHDERRRMQILDTYFRELDEAVGALSGLFDQMYGSSRRLTLLLSDHGFQRLDRYFNIQQWLIRSGFACRNRSVAGTAMARKLLQYLVKADRFRLRKRAFFNKQKSRLNNPIAYLDRERSAACAIGSCWGNVFVLNEDKGLVSELKTRLEEVRDPLTGRKIVRAVYLKNEIYSGGRLDFLPDMLVEPVPGYIIKANLRQDEFGSNGMNDESHVATHERQGIIVACGDRVVESSERFSANIWDVAPTVLHAMGFSYPDYMDGQVIGELFGDADLRVEPERCGSECDVAARSENEVRLSAEEEGDVMKSLKDLGYL